MADIDQKDVVGVVHEVVIAGVGGDVGLRTGSDCGGDEFATGAAAEGDAADGIGRHSGGAAHG